jgi:hypothetical protein
MKQCDECGEFFNEDDSNLENVCGPCEWAMVWEIENGLFSHFLRFEDHQFIHLNLYRP